MWMIVAIKFDCSSISDGLCRAPEWMPYPVSKIILSHLIKSLYYRKESKFFMMSASKYSEKSWSEWPPNASCVSAPSSPGRRVRCSQPITRGCCWNGLYLPRKKSAHISVSEGGVFRFLPLSLVHPVPSYSCSYPDALSRRIPPALCRNTDPKSNHSNRPGIMWSSAFARVSDGLLTVSTSSVNDLPRRCHNLVPASAGLTIQGRD
jgi:hypothetical protein